MYQYVNEKIMSHAKISRACANFLSDVDLKPGMVQRGGGINEAGTQQVRFVDSSCQVWSPCNMRAETRGLVRGSLSHQRHAPLAVLDLEFRWCRYREHLTGASSLTLFDVVLPEVSCVGLPRDKYRLTEIIDFSRYKPWFFIRANPLVRSIRNVTRLQTVGYRKRKRTRSLLVTIADEWSVENWSYWSPEYGYLDRMD